MTKCSLLQCASVPRCAKRYVRDGGVEHLHERGQCDGHGHIHGLKAGGAGGWRCGVSAIVSPTTLWARRTCPGEAYRDLLAGFEANTDGQR